jgi:hypothetical protein
MRNGNGMIERPSREVREVDGTQNACNVGHVGTPLRPFPDERHQQGLSHSQRSASRHIARCAARDLDPIVQDFKRRPNEIFGTAAEKFPLVVEKRPRV